MKTTFKNTQPSKIPRTRRFHIDCYPYIFSDEEREILEQKGHLLRSLAESKVKPADKEERRFVRVCQGKLDAFSIMEVAWLKYMHRQDIEARMHLVEDNYRESLS